MNPLFKPWYDMMHNWQKRHLTMPDYSFLFDPPPPGEWISLDCETTGLDTKKDHILTIAAVKVKDGQIKSSERLELTLRPPTSVNPASIRFHRLREADVENGMTAQEATHQLLNFIGSRPILGYNIKFDTDMLNRMVMPIIGVKLPNLTVDVAPMFHKFRQRQLGHGDIDLSFANIIRTLNLPMWAAHDAYNDALMTGLIFLSLQHKLNE